MPGLVGLITRRRREEAEQDLFRMVAALHHESFYVSGTWVDESLGVYVGWVAREGSFSEGMPVKNERRDAVLVFSGEEFPAPGTVERLKAHGHKIESSGPSYLIHQYEEDPSFLAGLNGRFHGLVADCARGTATLFNDRFGMHRLYIHESEDVFYFAAEAKAILAVRPDLRSLDPRGLGEFVACGAVMENRTLFEGIALLPQASAWVFRNGVLERKTSYFNPRAWEEQDALDSESFYQELREVFARNLPRYFAGSERIAMSLTGGLDTRMILAWLKPQPGSLPCYTFGGMFRECQDVLRAGELAALCDQPHRVIRVGEGFLRRFPYYAERAVYLSDGCADLSRSPDVFANEKAREIAPVRMTGNYGGEILRRVRTFKPEEALSQLFQPEFLAHIHNARETYANTLRCHPVSFAVFKQLPWNHYGILSLEESQLSLRSPFLDNDLVRTIFRAPAPALAGNELSLRLISDGDPNLLKIPTDRGLAGKMGRLGGAASRALLEFLFKAEYAYDIGMPQWLAKIDHMLSPLHPERMFLGRHKAFHFRLWYRDALAAFVKEVLLDPRSLSRPYIERKGLEFIVRGHLKGTSNYTAELHKVLSLELVHRKFLDEVQTHPCAIRPLAPIAAEAN